MNDQLLHQIADKAQREFPRECCGLVINSGVDHYLIECENMHHDPEHAFLIDPLVYHAHRDQIAAVYHSHPNLTAEPSQADIASAERCGVPFLILGWPSADIYTYIPQNLLPAPYEGREFVYAVNDCLSLVVDYYLHELGITISQGERKQWNWWHNPEHLHAFVNGWKNEGFQVVTDLQPGDLIIMQLRAVCPNHVAIYIGDSIILHHPSIGTPSRKEMYGHYWRSNTICYMRYQREND